MKAEYNPKIHKPKLSIKTEEITEKDTLENFYSEIKSYSITPRTFKSREFFKNVDDEVFTEQYEFKENAVTRFGINLHSKKFMGQL
jgi:hypothetical protein